MIDTAKLFVTILRVLSKLKVDTLFPDSVYDVILCYHAIEDDESIFSVSPGMFEDHVKQLSSSYSLVSVPEIIATKNDTKLPRVAITFDDGYKSIFTSAYPILSANNTTACIFMVGDKNMIQKQTGKKILTKKEVSTLVSSEWQIGWHTQNHRDLRQLNLAELKRDFVRHKNILKKSLNVDINYVAYPFGFYNERVKRLAYKSNFVAGFTVDGFKANSRSFDKYAIDRVTISSEMTADDVRMLLTPVGLMLNRLFTRLWRFKDSR